MTFEQAQSWKIEEFAYWKTIRRVEQFAQRVEHLQISARGVKHRLTHRDYTRSASERDFFTQHIEQNARHVERCLEAIRDFYFNLNSCPTIKFREYCDECSR